MNRNAIPVEWLRAVRQGRSAKWIARELLGDEGRYLEVHKRLLSEGAYAL